MKYCARTIFLENVMVALASGHAQQSLQKLKDSIWITYRCHIRAEKRNRFLEHYFHIVLALYALSSIAVALYPTADTSTGMPRFLNSFSSVFTLMISLLIFGFKFGEAAAKHRACYLELQKLRQSDCCDVTKLNNDYTNTLGYYSNHTYSDFMHSVMTNFFSGDQKIKDSSGNPYFFTKMQRFRFAAFLFFSWAFACAFAVGPFLLFVFSVGAFH